MRIDRRRYYFQHALSREKGKISSPFSMLFGLVSQLDKRMKKYLYTTIQFLKFFKLT